MPRPIKKAEPWRVAPFNRCRFCGRRIGAGELPAQQAATNSNSQSVESLSREVRVEAARHDVASADMRDLFFGEWENRSGIFDNSCYMEASTLACDIMHRTCVYTHMD